MPETTAASSPEGASLGIDGADAVDRLVEDAVALATRWINLAAADETRGERALGDRLARLVADPDGVAFTMRFVDRVARHRDDRAAARSDWGHARDDRCVFAGWRPSRHRRH